MKLFKRLRERVLAMLLLFGAIEIPASAQGNINYAEWRLEWDEEFNTPIDTTALTERWRFFYPWGRALASPIESSYYTAEELQTANGTLNLTMRKLATPRFYRGKQLKYNTGMLISRHPVDSLRPYTCNPAEGFSYGLFEVRARQPKTDGAAPGFWLYGGVPDEIDVFEATAHVVANNFHLAPGGYWRPSRQKEIDCQCFFYNTDPTGNLNERFHTYGMSWLPNGVTFYYDGVPIRHETRFIPAGCAMYVILNIAALAWATVPIDTLAVDYIRVYRPRQLPALPPIMPSAAYFPQTEQNWLPAETRPGLPDQATHQTWKLSTSSRMPRRLALMLVENYNPPCGLSLPLPHNGHWAPTWVQTDGMPDLQVLTPGPDSLHWAIHDLRGRQLYQGVTVGQATWRPRWDVLPPGTYALHLRQKLAMTVHPLIIMNKPLETSPDATWHRPITAAEVVK